MSVQAAGVLKLKSSVTEIAGVKLTFLLLTFWFVTLALLFFSLEGRSEGSGTRERTLNNGSCQGGGNGNVQRAVYCG